MAHLTIKNPFKNQGLAVFVTIGASFGKRFGKKKSFKTNEMPLMTQIVGQNVMGGGFWQSDEKKQVKSNVTEM